MILAAVVLCVAFTGFVPRFWLLLSAGIAGATFFREAMSIWLLYFVLLRATFFSFSGFASVPLVREDLVAHRATLTDEQLDAAIAISQTSPGPLGLYIVYRRATSSGVCRVQLLECWLSPRLQCSPFRSCALCAAETRAPSAELVLEL